MISSDTDVSSRYPVLSEDVHPQEEAVQHDKYCSRKPMERKMMVETRYV